MGGKNKKNMQNFQKSSYDMAVFLFEKCIRSKIVLLPHVSEKN